MRAVVWIIIWTKASKLFIYFGFSIEASARNLFAFMISAIEITGKIRMRTNECQCHRIKDENWKWFCCLIVDDFLSLSLSFYIISMLTFGILGIISSKRLNKIKFNGRVNICVCIVTSLFVYNIMRPQTKLIQRHTHVFCSIRVSTVRTRTKPKCYEL